MGEVSLGREIRKWEEKGRHKIKAKDGDKGVL